MHHLDPCHVKRAIRTACGGDAATATAVHQAIATGDWTRVEQALTAAQTQTRGAKRQALQRLQAYLHEPWDGIRQHPPRASAASKGPCIIMSPTA
jgi:hypothetical protein